MAEPFLAQIVIMGFNFAPRGWAKCDGQLLPIAQNQALFSLLGTTFGGDGETTFALPELRGRVPIHKGSSGGATHPLGERAGEENHTLTVGEIPPHSHSLQASGLQATSGDPDGKALAGQTLGTAPFYATPVAGGSAVALHGDSIANAGNSQGHNNVQPFTAVNYVIAITGLFPSRN